MRLFISHQSALEYWRKRRALPNESARRRYRTELADAQASVNPELALGLTPPIHIMLQAQADRRASESVCKHVFSGQTPVGCFVRADDGLMVSTPEFCFLQLAGKLSLIDLIEVGYELCGAYSLPPFDDDSIPERGFYQRLQLTSTKKLAQFLKDMPNVKGCKKAWRALRYLCDQSASPMETKLAMLLTLPYKLGGYGFAKPELNHRIVLAKSSKRYFRKSYYVCDLFWGEEKVAAEYDSDQHHTGSERIANDSEKRNALASHGIRVVTITRRQLFNSTELEGSARTLAGYLGKRLFSKKSNFAAAHRELRKLLL